MSFLQEQSKIWYEKAVEEFWINVTKNSGIIQPHMDTECWVWMMGKTKGYGNTAFLGKRFGTHRLSWMITYGEIEPHLFVCHHCDYPPCVRPDHLWLGTSAENIQDASRKGRLKKIKLGDDGVIDDYVNGQGTMKDIANRYGISERTVFYIVRNFLGGDYNRVRKERFIAKSKNKRG